MVAKEDLVSLRREFHQYPELGWLEFRTTARIAAKLDALDYDLYYGEDIMDTKKRLGVPDEGAVESARARAVELGAPKKFLESIGQVTGLIAEKKFGDGPTVGIRVDIDALNISEDSDADHRPAQKKFASTQLEVMHACGHDGHITIGVGIAHTVATSPDKFDGTLRLFFQPAEEGLRGGYAMANTDWLNDVDYFFGLHLGLGVPSGTVIAGARDFLASTKLDAVFQGESAHAGKHPQQGQNAIAAAATAVQNLYGIQRHEEGQTRINVGKIEAGAERNTIPDSAILHLEVRGGTTAVNEYMEQRARTVLSAAADMYELDVDIKMQGKAVTATPSEPLVQQTMQSFRDLGNFETVEKSYSFGASEDATYLMERVQEEGGEATYLVFGTDLASGHHTSRFDFDEDVLFQAVEGMTHLLEQLQA